MSCQKILLLVKNHLQIKHVVLKQLELQQAILMQIVSSGSLTEAISRISAMNEIADANNKMLQEQKRDKEDIAQKQKENNDSYQYCYCK